MFYKSSQEAALNAANSSNGKSDWQVVFSDQHESTAVVVLAAENSAPAKQVLCQQAGEFWRPLNQGQLLSFLPYTPGSKLGVETYFWKVNESAKSVLLKVDFEEVELEVNQGYVFYTFWDVKGNQFARWWTSPYPDFELWVDFERVWRYHDTSILDNPVEAKEFCQAHYRHFRDKNKDDAWVSDIHYGMNIGHDELFRMILMLVTSVADPVGDADYLIHLGQTHMSDLFGPWLLNKLETMDNPDPRLLLALAGVEIDFEPHESRQRSEKLLGPFAGIAKLQAAEQQERLNQIFDENSAHAKAKREKSVRIGLPRN